MEMVAVNSNVQIPSTAFFALVLKDIELTPNQTDFAKVHCMYIPYVHAIRYSISI